MQKENVQKQFKKRANSYNDSANWITDKTLINAHVNFTEQINGKGLELCCGTGIIGKTLTANGWQMTGIDITESMVKESGQYFPVLQGNAEELPFEKDYFDLVVMRQALFFLDSAKVLKEVKRVLKNEGCFILSQTVPFSDIDTHWLKKIHLAKQTQMLNFYTDNDLRNTLTKNGFMIEKQKFLTVRESITKWMEFAPELSAEKRKEICDLVRNAPESYRRIRNVESVNGELLENWNWVIFKTKI